MSNEEIPKITLWSCILGHGLEMYDFTLYGAFITIIALNFFSGVGSESSFFLALIALSVGYIARPLGAMLFGYIGDIYGRKKSLIFTILLASLATGTIGLCPSYTSIGILASVTLFLARLTQGLCAGAETSSASVFLIEHCTTERSSYGSAMIFLSGGSGCLIALLISKVFISLDFVWAWRIPFIIGLLVGGIILYLRFRVEESIEFKNNYVKKDIASFVFFSKLIKNHSFGLIKAFFCGTLSGITSTTIVVFVNLFLYKILNVRMSTSIVFSVYGLSSFLFSCFICSKISSRIIRDKVIISALIGLILWSVPYFYLISTRLSTLIIFAQIILGFLAGSFIAPIKSFLAEQFPVSVRCTGVSVGYNTGYALTSGLYPIMAFQLIEITGNIYAPAIFIFLFAVLLLFVVVMTLNQPQTSSL